MAQVNITPPGGVTVPETAPGATLPGGTTTVPGQGTTAISPTGTTTGAPPAAVTLPPINILPLGTTVQNPSTQLVPGASDTYSGIFTLGAGDRGEDLGMTLGSFRLYPQLDISAGYDTNVFAQSASQGVVGSPYTTIAPSLALRSEWLNHQLNMLLSANFGLYSATPTQNYQNYVVLADGQIDVREDTQVKWSIGYKRATEALGSPNVAFAQSPTVDESIPVILSINKRFNRFWVDAGVSATPMTFTDYSTITSQGLTGAQRNRTEYEEHIRFGYDVSDELSVYMTPSVKQIRYVENIDPTTGLGRDQDIAQLVFGATVILNPTSSLDGYIGYMNQSTVGQGAIGDITFGLTGTWNAYEPLTVRPMITRAFSQSALSGYQSYINTTYGFDFNYRIHEDWTMIGGASLTSTDYQVAPGASGVTPRTDYFLRGSIGLLYSIRPQIQIGPVIEYTQGSSTDPVNGPSYDRELFSIRLIGKR